MSVGTGSAAAQRVMEALDEARERTLNLVASVSVDDLERVHSPLMSPLAWDLGHIAAFEDLWLVSRYAGRPLLHEELAGVYDAFETPRARRGDLPMLSAPDALEYLEAVRARTFEVVAQRGVGDGRRHELVVRHEQQHNETMLQTIQLAALDGYRTPGPAALDGYPSGPAWRAPRGSGPAWREPPGSLTGLEMVAVDAGPCALGAPSGAFSYDNERPRHPAELPGFLIGRCPVTNASYLRFVEGGGYERREWWSDEGWAWKEQYDITRPAAWTADLAHERRVDGLVALDPNRPAVHLSCYEAEAFARAHDARLPTEAEWEKAATWDPAAARAQRYPWGEEPPRPGFHANVDQLAGGPLPVGAHPAGASPSGCLAMIGDVWEWTASPFGAYPGFVADPYREYSEVFFGSDYRVLRGGSWATRARVATPTFRNWDFPQRRQIFSGVRLARDL